MSLERILEFATTYGYGFLFVTSVAESTFLLGLVVPGDVVVVLGGGLAAQARLEATLVAVVVIVGTVLGSILSFVIGRRGESRSAVRKKIWARFAVEPQGIERVHAYFRRHGAKTVFGAAFVSGLKNLVPAVAGACEMGFGRFVAYNAAGSAVRCLALVAIGYACGANLSRALDVGAAGERVGSGPSCHFGRSSGAAFHSKSAPSLAKLAQSAKIVRDRWLP